MASELDPGNKEQEKCDKEEGSSEEEGSGDEGSDPKFKCAYCENMYAQKKSLYKHTRICHPGKKQPVPKPEKVLCVNCGTLLSVRQRTNHSRACHGAIYH